MSETEKTEGDGSEEFDFYFGFTKTLVLDLPSSDDRSIAAAWVQKIEGEERSKERLNYLKLLLFVLQRGRLCGIFRKQPPSGPLQPFPQGIGIIEMGNLMLDQDDGGGGDARSIPYEIELSNDMREFVASQEVPNFGIQMYYAWSSDEPIYEWTAFDEDKVPKVILEKIKHIKEIKSDRKSSGQCDTLKKKKLFNTTLEGSSKIEVKSPQEIEKSQGRSFHTYMGLVGQMGNFGNKCDDDPEKYQRQDPTKEKGPPGRCPGKRPQRSGGEMEDYEIGPSGLNSINRPCLCPYPCHHQECPEYRQQKRPQRDDQYGGGSSGYSVRNDFSNSGSPGVPVPMHSRRRADPCPEGEMSQVLPQRGPPAREKPRSSSGNRAPVIECPDDSGGRLPHTGVCICTAPPCTCPCPRESARKPHSAGGSPAQPRRTSPAPGPSQTRTVVKPSQQSMRPPGEYLTSFKAPSPYIQRTPGTDESPFGGRSGGSPGFSSSGSPEGAVFNETRMPNPCATEVINRCRLTPQKGLTGPVATNNFKVCNPEDNYVARKQLFAPKGVSTPSVTRPARLSMQTEYCSTIAETSPELMTHPLCDNSPTASPELMQHPLCENTPSPQPDYVQQQMYDNNGSPELMQDPLCENTPSGTSQSPNTVLGRQDVITTPQYQQNYQECEENFPTPSPPASTRIKTPDFRQVCAQARAVARGGNTSLPLPPFPGSACPPTANTSMPGNVRDIYANQRPEMQPLLNRLLAMKQRSAASSKREKCPPETIPKSPTFEPPCDPQTRTVTKPRTAQVLFDNEGISGSPLGQRNMRFSPNTYYSPQLNYGTSPQDYNFREGYTSLPIAPQNSPQSRFVMNQQDLYQRQQRLENLGQNCYPPEENAGYEEEECEYESSGSADTYGSPISQHTYPMDNNECNPRNSPYGFDPSKEWYSFP